jgi:tetratricopeptide (TPR) repeat protein
LFDLQDDLVPRIVSTVADMFGVLPHSMSEAVHGKEPGTLTPYEAVLRGFSYAERVTAEEHAVARASLERVLRQVPGYADGWIMLSMIYCDEYSIGCNPLPESLARAEDAARRAVDAAPGNHRAYFSLAYALFHRKEFAEFRNAAERALALNPLDGSTVWTMGLCMAYAGDWERGCNMVERAMQLNPSHPGKYWYPIAVNAYRKRDYPSAVNFALKINTPGLFYTPLLIAAAQAQFGDMSAASKALRELLRLRPDYGAIAREDLGKWFDAELVEHYIEGLHKAGLEVQPANAAVRHA